MPTDFDDMAARFTHRIQANVGWRENYFGAAYATRIRSAIKDLKDTIREAEAHPEIGTVE